MFRLAVAGVVTLRLGSGSREGSGVKLGLMLDKQSSGMPEGPPGLDWSSSLLPDSSSGLSFSDVLCCGGEGPEPRGAFLPLLAVTLEALPSAFPTARLPSAPALSGTDGSFGSPAEPGPVCAGLAGWAALPRPLPLALPSFPLLPF